MGSGGGTRQLLGWSGTPNRDRGATGRAPRKTAGLRLAAARVPTAARVPPAARVPTAAVRVATASIDGGGGGLREASAQHEARRRFAATRDSPQADRGESREPPCRQRDRRSEGCGRGDRRGHSPATRACCRFACVEVVETDGFWDVYKKRRRRSDHGCAARSSASRRHCHSAGGACAPAFARGDAEALLRTSITLMLDGAGHRTSTRRPRPRPRKHDPAPAASFSPERFILAARRAVQADSVRTRPSRASSAETPAVPW